MITEVAYTENSNVTRLSPYCPPNTDVGAWLARIVHDLVIASPTQRMYKIAGIGWTIDRKNVTRVDITWSQ